MHSQGTCNVGPWLRRERLTAAHTPRLWGAPELKDKQAEGRLEVAEAAWNGKQHHGAGGQTREGSRTGQSARW